MREEHGAQRPWLHGDRGRAIRRRWRLQASKRATTTTRLAQSSARRPECADGGGSRVGSGSAAAQWSASFTDSAPPAIERDLVSIDSGIESIDCSAIRLNAGRHSFESRAESSGSGAKSIDSLTKSIESEAESTEDAPESIDSAAQSISGCLESHDLLAPLCLRALQSSALE